jgi:hypothetical protein
MTTLHSIGGIFLITRPDNEQPQRCGFSSFAARSFMKSLDIKGL